MTWKNSKAVSQHFGKRTDLLHLAKRTFSVLRKDIRLSELACLALDCQATGADPAKNQLLEMAWLRCKSQTETSPIPVSSYLIREADEVVIPPRVVRVTGLTVEDFEVGCSSEAVWPRLL